MNAKTRQATREWFRDNALACIADAESGVIELPSHTSLADYRAYNLARADEAMAGAYDHTFTFRQRAEWIETGTCRPLLQD